MDPTELDGKCVEFGGFRITFQVERIQQLEPEEPVEEPQVPQEQEEPQESEEERGQPEEPKLPVEPDEDSSEDSSEVYEERWEPPEELGEPEEPQDQAEEYEDSSSEKSDPEEQAMELEESLSMVHGHIEGLDEAPTAEAAVEETYGDIIVACSVRLERDKDLDQKGRRFQKRNGDLDSPLRDFQRFLCEDRSMSEEMAEEYADALRTCLQFVEGYKPGFHAHLMMTSENWVVVRGQRLPVALVEFFANCLPKWTDVVLLYRAAYDLYGFLFDRFCEEMNRQPLAQRVGWRNEVASVDRSKRSVKRLVDKAEMKL